MSKKNTVEDHANALRLLFMLYSKIDFTNKNQQNEIDHAKRLSVGRLHGEVMTLERWQEILPVLASEVVDRNKWLDFLLQTKCVDEQTHAALYTKETQ